MARLKNEHLHRDTQVTLDRLNSFAEAPRSVQVASLAQLRSDAEDDASSVELTLIGIALAAITSLTLREGVDFGSMALPEAMLTGTVVAVAIVVSLVPAIAAAAVRSNRRRYGVIWSRAFEDELQRRRTASGRAARRWKQSH